MPLLQRFTIKPPNMPPITGPIAVALTERHLYLRVGDELYRAPAPTPTTRR